MQPTDGKMQSLNVQNQSLSVWNSKSLHTWNNCSSGIGTADDEFEAEEDVHEISIDKPDWHCMWCCITQA